MSPEPEGISADAETGAIIESVLSQLSALDAIGSDPLGGGWLEADQIRYVRVFVEEGIAQLARGEEAQFALMAECAQLAGENMQDARLHLIEERLEPAEETLGGFLVNLGLMLAVELAVVSGASFVLPAILGIAATRLQSLRARQLVTSRVTERHRASEGLAAMEKIFKAKKQEHADAITEWHKTKLNALERSTARVAVFKAKNDYAVALQALETSETLLQKAQAAVAAAPKTAVGTKLKSSQLQTFMTGVFAPTTLSRVAENSAVVVTQKIIDSGGSAGATELTEPFKTSTLVGLFLAETAREQDEAAETWAATQLHIRSLTDDQFINSELAQQLFFCVHREPASATVRDMVAMDRDGLIRGIEGALWLAWLRTIDALGKTEVSGVSVIGGVEGRVHGTLFIEHVTTSEGSDPSEHFGTTRTQRFADGTVYPGLDRIRDGHAEYLYGRFAHDFFTQNPERALPLVFDAARYDEVASLPVNDLLGPNQDRLARVAEMKLLVIEFFRIFSADPPAIGGPGGAEARAILRTLLELTADADPVDDFLESLPPISDPNAPDAGEGDLADSPGESLSSLFEASPERLARDAATKLASLVTDLDLTITRYEAATLATSEQVSAPTAEADELLAAIASQQDEVRKQYEDFQSLASGQTALLDEVKTGYESRIDRLTAWPPAAWNWYGPPAPEASTIS